MKKVTNIVMSALALTAGCAGMLTANVLADNGMQRDVLRMESNEYGGWMSIMQVEPGKNQLVFMPGDGDGTWGTMRVVIAQEDYEAGATEAEADTELEKLGTDEGSRFVVLYDEDMRNRAFIPLWSPVLKDNGLLKNKTDRLYYAVQHGHQVSDVGGEVSWEDVWWERGKIDYRGCVHSSVYSQGTTLCNQKFDDSGTKVTYVASDNKTGAEKVVPVGEKVITWEEEWRQIREKRLDSLQSKLEILQWNVDNFEKIITEAETDLEKLEVTLNGDQDVDLALRVQDLQMILKKLQELMAEYDIDGIKEELEALKAELVKLSERCVTLEGEKQMAVDENEVLKTEVATLKEKLAQAEAKVTNDDGDRVSTNGDISVPERVAQGVAVSGDVSAAVVGDQDTKDREATQDDVRHDEQGRQDEKNEDVEVNVPSLGEVENKVNLWWILLPIVVFVGTVGLAIRHFRRK